MGYRILNVVVAVQSGVISGLVTGILTVAGGANLAPATISGFGAFVVTVPLALLLTRELGPPPSEGN
jgi:hypothetical protein